MNSHLSFPAYSYLPSTTGIWNSTSYCYKRPDDFIAIAKRGYFVYDWSDIHRNSTDEIAAYELIAKPIVPILVEALPTSLANFTMNTCFDYSNFSENKLLDITIYTGVINHKK